MNSRLLLIPAIVAATVTLSAPHSAICEPNDAQAQAAALLSGLPASGKLPASVHVASSSQASADAQASAAALLTGRSASGKATTLVRVQAQHTQRAQRDAQALAAALLGGSRTRDDDALREASPTAISGE